jgi:UDP-glucose 4-epimerase
MKILITGSSGYIGSHLQVMLEKHKHEVYCLDFQEPKIETKNFVNVDIRMPIGIDIEFDAVIHLAALVNVSESVYKPSNYYTTNINGTVNVLNGIKTKNFIFASTGAAVGMVSPYGLSKRAAEDCVLAHCKSNNIDYTIFRFFNVIGGNVVEPTNPDGLFYNLKLAPNIGYFTIFGDDYNTKDGTCVRDYVHVNEICTALMYAVEKPSNSIEHLGHGKGHTVLEMVNLFKETNNARFETKYGSRRPGDMESSVLDTPSKYMNKLYSLADLLKIDNN